MWILNVDLAFAWEGFDSTKRFFLFSFKIAYYFIIIRNYQL